MKRSRFIGLFTGAAFVVSVIVSLLLPKYYSATASLMPPAQDSNILSPGLSSIAGGVSGIAGSFLGVKSPADIWIGVLKSRNVRDSVIERFNLKEIYGTVTMDSTRRAFASHVAIQKSKESIVSISVESKDPELAADLANALVEELDRLNRRATMTSGQRMRSFVEKRLEEAKRDLVISEEALRKFQEENKAVKLDDQSKAIIEAIGALKGELMAKEVALKTLLSYAIPENPQAQLLKVEISGLQDQLKELEKGRKSATGSRSYKDIFIPTDSIPGLTSKYARLLRDVKVHQALFELLVQQYEMARIQEAKDTPTVQLLDSAVVPDKRSRPRRSVIVVLSVLTAAFFSILISFFIEYVDGLKRDKISAKA